MVTATSSQAPPAYHDAHPSGMPTTEASTRHPAVTPPSYVDPVHTAFLAIPASANPAPLPTTPRSLPSYWLKTSVSPGPEQKVYNGSKANGTETPPQWDSEVDVAIIGSGITGVSAAYHLVDKWSNRRGPGSKGKVSGKIAVFEARDFCSGATGRNGGHLTGSSILSYTDMAANPEHLAKFIEGGSDAPRSEHWGNDRGSKTDETIRKMLTLESRTVAELILRIKMRTKLHRPDGSKADVGEDPELVCGSNWHLCFTQAEVDHFSNSIEAAKRAGLSDFAAHVRQVPDDELQKRLNKPHGIVGAFEIPGGTVHSRRLVTILWRWAQEAARANGVDLKAWTSLPVTRIEAAASTGAHSSSSSEEDKSTTLFTERGPVKAKYVIHATNAYVSHLLPEQFTGPHRGVVPTRGQCIAVRPSTSPNKGEPLWTMGFSINNGYEYLQQRPPSSQPDQNGKAPLCILGGGREAAKGNEWNVADDSTVDAGASAALRPMLSRTFPSNFHGDPAEVELEWTGIMGFTKSFDPFVGPVPVASQDDKEGVVHGQYVSAGYSGHGMSRAYSCAEVVADMIFAEMGGRKWEPPSWFPLAFLTRFPPRGVVESDVQSG